MKIKKVAQTPGVLATVSTSKIDSDKDTYSCNYLNDNAVVVSPTEPSEGKVWLQKGKNLFDTSLLKQGNWNASNNFERVVWGIKVKAGTTYTLTNYSSRRVSAFETSTLEQSISGNSVLVEHGSIDGNGNLTFTTKNNAYLRLLFSNIDSSQISVNDIISSNIQIEQGEMSSPYAPYIPKKIHTKTDNGYEEFYNEEEHRDNYSISEQRIGTWIDGKPLYRKTFYITSGISANFGIDINDLNFEYLRIKNAMMDYLIQGVRYIRPTYFGDATDNFSLFERKNTIQIRSSKNAEATYYNLSFDLEYTKTTD